MRILGVSAYHDSAAAQEERFTRRKHDAGFPRPAIEYCLGESGGSLAEVDHVVFYDKPFLKFERLLETYLAFAPRGFASFSRAVPLWLREKLFQKSLLKKQLKAYAPSFDWERRLLFAVASAPAAFHVRVWAIMSRGWRPRTARPRRPSVLELAILRAKPAEIVIFSAESPTRLARSRSASGFGDGKTT